MSGFQTVHGFQDVWRPVALPRRTPDEVLGRLSPVDIRRKLGRLVAHAPEVMVKVTGRIHNAGGLKAHLAYITRNGNIDLDSGDGVLVRGGPDVRALADDWARLAELDARRRANTPMVLSVVLSMPRGVDPDLLLRASRTFAAQTLGDRFDHGMALHLDAPHPHVHLVIRMLGREGERLAPGKTDLQVWRDTFAEALRAVGVQAEATPRRTRGVTRKAERGVVRRLRLRFEAGGPPARVLRSAYREAAEAAFRGPGALRPWEVQMVTRQRRIRTLYLEQARLLAASDHQADRRLGAALSVFVSALAPPDSRRLELARVLRAAETTRGERLTPARER